MIPYRTVYFGTILDRAQREVISAFPSTCFQMLKPTTKRTKKIQNDPAEPQSEHNLGESESGSEIDIKRQHRHPFVGLCPIEVERGKENPWLKTKLIPSVTFIEGCTSSKEALYLWQKNFIKSTNEALFRRHCLEQMRRGNAIHSVIQNMLISLKEKGKLSSPSDDLLKRIEEEKITGYFDSILEFVCSLKNHDLMCMEKMTYSVPLCYKGKFDAIIEWEGELTLVDWKTVNSMSAKSHKEGEHKLEDLYGNPLQIAAYVAAVNSDPAFAHLPKIKQAAIVQVFDDGRPANIVLMEEKKIKHYFDKYLTCLNDFWWKVESAKDNESVSFVYDPRTPEEILSGEPQKKKPTWDQIKVWKEWRAKKKLRESK